MAENSPREELSQDHPLAKALRDAEAAPEREEIWDTVTDLAAEHQHPDEVAETFWKVLQKPLAPALASAIGERAARFHDEWFEDPAPLARALRRVLELDPDAEWAFHRLTLLFTKTERWADLLALYDLALTRTQEKSRRIELLDEAAHVAKDFAGQADRAIQYLEQLFPLKPTDAQLATSLERLFEKQARYADLIKLWTARVAVLPRDAAQATRARIAACWLDHLENPAEALAATEQLLAADKNDAAALGLLERIVALSSADAPVRRKALSHLRERYAAADRGADIVRVLSVGLEFADGDERVTLRHEIRDRLVAQGRDADAVEHAAALLVLRPDADEYRVSLRELAERTSAHARYAEALAQSADAAGEGARSIALLVEAAEVRCNVLHDEPGAIDLYARVLAAPAADEALLLGAARHACQLLETAGRKREQLDVLERLSTLEPEADERRTALGRAARLADELGEADRALASWDKRLKADGEDREALDAMIDLLDRAERFPRLIEALRRRADAKGTEDSARRTDLVRIARVHEERLNEIDASIRTWTEVAESFGTNAETVDALSALLAAGERWTALAKLLADAASTETEDTARRAQLLQRLGDVLATRLDDAAGATERYKEALLADARNEGARAGLRTLLANPRCVASAVEALARAYAATDEWTLTLEILEPRLSAAGDDAERTLILLEAAQLHEERASDRASALACVCRAFPYAPSDASIEREVLRLAEATDDWQSAVDAYRAAIKTADEAPARVLELQYSQGTLLEHKLSDLAAALGVYTLVTIARPDHAEATPAVVRVASRIGRWDASARAIVSAARASGKTDASLFASVDAIATETSAWDAACEAFEKALAGDQDLRPVVARELETQLALWHRDRREDADSAEAALLRATAHDGTDPETLRMLAALQRRAQGRPLVDTLLRLADATGDDADALHEAAEVSLERLADRALALPILTRLLAVSSERWKSGEETTSASGRGPEYHAAWVLEHLVKLHIDAGEHARAVELLAENAKLPFEPDTSRMMRRRAAEIATERLGDAAGAIALYRGILSETPQDTQTIARLAALYEAQNQLADLLALRRHELSFADDVARRLELRLDVARVLGVLSDREGRIAALRENLDERPGHPASVAELTAILEGAGDHAGLADVLTEQATRLQDLGESAASADLWSRVAHIAETQLNDVERALASHGRVVELAPTLASLDALARLHTARGEHAQAVAWLSRRLEMSPGDERAATVVRLAQSQRDAGRSDRAVSVLEGALAEDPSAGAVRQLLAELYRAQSSWAPLAALLTEGTSYLPDAAAQLGSLREAAEIYHRHLEDPSSAIPILERASELAPTDRAVRTSLADALRAAGRLDEARDILAGLVEEFGRRRPPERAAVHFQLAQIARARGDEKDALAQLDLAASMDVNHPGIHRMLGDLAKETGQFERAERAYRALLLIVRRQAQNPDLVIGPSEVLFELYQIATQLGQPDRAREILESGFETAAQSPLEARRFERALKATGNAELLLRSLENRLARAEDSATQAQTLNELSDILADLGRLDEALDARMRALALTPASGAVHDAAAALALRAGNAQRYADGVREMVGRARDAHDTPLVAELLLRLGEATENSIGNLESARDSYQQAEATGEHQVRAWRALDRVCGKLADAEGQARALRSLVNSGAPELDAQERTDGLYRLAAIELRSDETRGAGSDTLAWALDQDPQYERAALLLKEPTQSGTEDPKSAALFERVARALSDEALLLTALERVAAQPDASMDTLREAVELAGRMDEGARAEALLERAIDLARNSATGLPEGVWALVQLGERRKEAGDLTGAIKWLRLASESAEGPEALQLGLEVATLAAGPVGDLNLAAEVYEKLRERDPADRNVWEPLLDVYRSLGDRERLEALIAATLENVFETSERNRLRMERARILLADKGREEDAASQLRDILDEDPSERDAAVMLSDLYERTGREGDLADLLARQLDSARDRQDGPTVSALSLRLGALQEKRGERSEAISVYRSALDWSPEDRTILKALLRAYTPDDDAMERADAMEKLLALETGSDASQLALELVAIRESAGDEPGTERALERGFRANPAHTAIRERLNNWYESREDYSSLAAMLEFDAESRKDSPSESVALLRRAAGLYKDKLSNATAAADMLRRARKAAPEDAALLADYVRSVAAAGDAQAALDEVTQALEDSTRDAQSQCHLLKLRAEVYLGQENGALAVADLERAVSVGGASHTEELAKGLARHREIAMDKGEWDAARAATLRLIEVHTSLGATDQARELLTDWTGREPNDRDAIRMLADMNAAAERWDDVADAFRRLIELEEGDGKITAALRLAEACEKLGRLPDARDGLESVYRASPNSDPVRAYLRKLYEAAEAWHDLAELCVADAEAATEDPVKFERLRRAGEIWISQGDLAAAMVPLERAMAMRPGDNETTALLADAYTGSGRIQEATTLLEGAIAGHKGRRSRELAMLQHRMARVAAAAGDRQIELAWLNVALDSDMQNGQVASELADVAFEFGNVEVALKALRAVTLMKNPTPMTRAMAFLRQGMIAQQQGDPRKAIFLAKKALAEDPNLSEASTFLRELGE